MQFGHFDDEAREYVIETPHMPDPWSTPRTSTGA